MLVLGDAGDGEGSAARFGCVEELGSAMAGTGSGGTTLSPRSFAGEFEGDRVRPLHVKSWRKNFNTPKQRMMTWKTNVGSPTPKALFPSADKPLDCDCGDSVDALEEGVELAVELSVELGVHVKLGGTVLLEESGKS